MISEQTRTFFTSITLDANKNRIQQTWINHEEEFESVKICQIRKLEQKVQSRSSNKVQYGTWTSTRKGQDTQMNITREEKLAIKTLHSGISIIIMPASQDNIMVVMDKLECFKKMVSLIGDGNHSKLKTGTDAKTWEGKLFLNKNRNYSTMSIGS